MLSDSNDHIRSIVDATLSEFLSEIKNKKAKVKIK